MNEKPQIITPLKDLVLNYQEAKDRIKALDDEYDKAVEPLKQAKAHFQEKIISQLKESEQLSARFDEVTATLAKKKTAKVVDPVATISHLKALGLTQYISESLNESFESVLKEIEKSGELMPGIVINETEYLTTRASKKELPKEQLKEIK